MGHIDHTYHKQLFGDENIDIEENVKNLYRECDIQKHPNDNTA